MIDSFNWFGFNGSPVANSHYQKQMIVIAVDDIVTPMYS